MKYVALLRGINVGGKNVIKMANLRACFERMRFTDVQTYIQSGNILFRGTGGCKSIESSIARALLDEFDCDTKVFVIQSKKFAGIIEGAPTGYGSDPKKYQYDVIFLKKPLSVAKAMNAVELREGVDDIYKSNEALFFRRLKSQASNSKLSKIVSKPEYGHMTIRNWNTCTKLLALLETDS